MISEDDLLILLDQLDQLERENAEQATQIDWLMRERILLMSGAEALRAKSRLLGRGVLMRADDVTDQGEPE